MKHSRFYFLSGWLPCSWVGPTFPPTVIPINSNERWSLNTTGSNIDGKDSQAFRLILSMTKLEDSDFYTSIGLAGSRSLIACYYPPTAITS